VALSYAVAAPACRRPRKKSPSGQDLRNESLQVRMRHLGTYGLPAPRLVVITQHQEAP